MRLWYFLLWAVYYLVLQLLLKEQGWVHSAGVLLALAYRKLNLSGLFDTLIKTLEITTLILFLVAASNFFGAVFSRLGTPMLLTDYMMGL